MQVAFRVDASNKIGTGHLMRCLTLADTLKMKGDHSHFFCRHLPDSLRELLVQRGHDLIVLEGRESPPPSDDLKHSRWLGASQARDAQDMLRALSGSSWDWLIVDHYALDARWESALHQSVKRTMVIDDIADRQHDCDILLDQNFYVDMEQRYIGKVPPHCQLLLGPHYALLREEFRQLHGQVKSRLGPVKRVLVFFGGVDANNYTGKAIKALANLVDYGLHVDVVIGAEQPAREKIEADCWHYGFECHVQTTRMAELMAAADLAIGASGSASWERCCLGLPAFAICAAENQRQLIADAALECLLYAPDIKEGLTETIERHVKALMENPALRNAISRNGMRVVDGRGVLRVVRHMGYSDIKIRVAVNDDLKQLFEWRNHLSVREVSRNSEAISWQSHQKWFSSMLSDRNRALLVGMRQDQPIGVVRFDIQGEGAEVSIYLVPGSEAQGLGSELLQCSERWLAERRPEIRRIYAEVIGGNEPSHRMFSGSGYEIESTRYSKRLIVNE